MLFKLTMIVWFMAIVGFFSREFVDLFKKMASVRSLSYLVPLLLFSCLVEYYQDALSQVLVVIRVAGLDLQRSLFEKLPHHRIVSLLIRVGILSILASLPLLAAHLSKHFHHEQSWSLRYRVSVLLWIVGCILIVM